MSNTRLFEILSLQRTSVFSVLSSTFFLEFDFNFLTIYLFLLNKITKVQMSIMFIYSLKQPAHLQYQQSQYKGSIPSTPICCVANSVVLTCNNSEMCDKQRPLVLATTVRCVTSGVLSYL